MRMPLYAALSAVLCCAGCAGSALVPSPGLPTPGEGTTTTGARITVAPVPPRPPTTAREIPPPKSVVSIPNDGDVFTSATTVAAEWLRHWCALDWQEPMNANLDRASHYETTAAAREDRRRGDDANTYASMRAQQVSSSCADVTAAQSPEAPNSTDVVYLVLAARRTTLAAGKPTGDEPVRDVRRVIRQADGRWLVDLPVEAG